MQAAIHSKTVDGKTTTCTCGKANRLVTLTSEGITANYACDAAGRLVKEKNMRYTYGYLDKIFEVQENGTMVANFTYHMDGQIASATQIC